MLIAFFMVSLPLPDRASTAGNTWRDHLNLIPFWQLLFTELPLIIAGWLMGRRFAFIIDIVILGLVFISRIYFFI